MKFTKSLASAVPNPNGILPSSPGLSRLGDYPGKGGPLCFQPQRGCDLEALPVTALNPVPESRSDAPKVAMGFRPWSAAGKRSSVASRRLTTHHYPPSQVIVVNQPSIPPSHALGTIRPLGSLIWCESAEHSPSPGGEGRGEGEAIKPIAAGHRIASRPSSWSSFGLYTLAFSLLLASSALAYPPAPDALVYGLVKDQYGTPLASTGDTVILQTSTGVQVAATIQPNLAIGVNYAVDVPMDAGTIPTLYAANALISGTQFTLNVAVGTTTNVPIEMVNTNLLMDIPASKRRQDLTLGTDSNGDGIPDQWEQVFLSEIGSSLPLSRINPNGIYTSDGRTLKQEYLLGNYPYNPTDDFSVQIVSQHAGSAVLAFTTMTGRTYTAYGSSDLQNWTPLSFNVPAAGTVGQSSYYAATIQPLQIQTIQPASGPQMQFFKLELQ